jgi:hypothetical protein
MPLTTSILKGLDGLTYKRHDNTNPGSILLRLLIRLVDR